jgi:hypothetical protein
MIVLLCITRCNGGFLEGAWDYLKRDGIVTGGPYNSHQVSELYYKCHKNISVLKTNDYITIFGIKDYRTIYLQTCIHALTCRCHVGIFIMYWQYSGKDLSIFFLSIYLFIFFLVWVLHVTNIPAMVNTAKSVLYGM